LADLSQHQIKYLLVGGLAVALCGYTRATIDVDILIDNSKENIDLLLNRLIHFGEGFARELSYQDFDLAEGCIRINEDFQLDIFTIMHGNTYQDLLKYARVHDLENGVQIKYLGREGLIKLKQFSLRPKDQLDVQILKEMMGESPQPLPSTPGFGKH
jgi:hypothetical protein